MKKLNLGAGLDIREDYDNQDYQNMLGINIIFDLENEFPLKDNIYDYILCNHVIEHINNLFGFFDEVHRIAKPSATIKIEVPHYSVNFAFTQIDHKHYFGLDSLSILDGRDFQNKTKNFKLINQRILFRGGKSSRLMRMISKPIDYLVNFNHFTQLITDRFLSKLIPFYSMEYSLEVVK